MRLLELDEDFAAAFFPVSGKLAHPGKSLRNEVSIIFAHLPRQCRRRAGLAAADRTGGRKDASARLPGIARSSRSCHIDFPNVTLIAGLGYERVLDAVGKAIALPAKSCGAIELI